MHEEAFEILRDGYALTVGNQLLPSIGATRTGMIVYIFDNAKDADEYLQTHEVASEDLNLGQAGRQRVGDPLEFMRLAAGQGLTGIEFVSQTTSIRFMFMLRVEEAGRALPTVLTSISDQGLGTSLTRTGLKDFDHAEILHWERFDIIDRPNGFLGQRCPFRDWNDGDPIYEIYAPQILLISEVQMLKDWNSTEGAYPFFTSEEKAWNYIQHDLGSGPVIQSASLDEWLSGSKEEDEIRPVPILNFAVRLNELRAKIGIAAWCVNPADHRENSAIGRMWDNPFDDGSYPMRSTAGLWSIQPNNKFKLVESMPTWSGHDTIRWSGGMSLKLNQLERSFAEDETPIDQESLSDSEALEVVEKKLYAEDLQDFYDSFSDYDVDGEFAGEECINLFHFIAWDSVTGDRGEYPARFKNFFQALSFLSTYERLFDQNYRIHGARSCSIIGFWGSGNEEFEKTRGDKFQLGLRRIGLRVLRDGYKPTDAEDLVALCNGTLRTLHVEYAGYPLDLLWANARDDDSPIKSIDGESITQRDLILRDLQLDPEMCADELQKLSVPVDHEGRSLALKRMSLSDWEMLDPKVKHFISTGLLHLEWQGHAPMMDYAPISIEIVKALETELGQMLLHFRNQSPTPTEFDSEQIAEQALAKFLYGGRPPTLGQIGYLLKKPKADCSPLVRSFSQFVLQLPNAGQLTEKKFVNNTIPKIMNKYRNGGAHDSTIAEGVCRECVDTLVGTTTKRGLIPMIAGWKSDSEVAKSA